LELPQGARGASLIEDSSPQATANGPRVIVTGPFASGTTRVNIRFELPHSGPSVTLVQRWPAPLQQVEVFALKTGDMNIRSPQFASSQASVQQGQAIIAASGPAMALGVPFTLEITGLPYHPTWPRLLALAAAAAIIALGLWSAFMSSAPRSRTRAA
jgi:hypothetical protein